MRVLYDGIIYSLQSSGGITRYANEIISRTSLEDQASVLVHKKYFNLPPKDANIQNIFVSSGALIYNNKFIKYLLYFFDKIVTEKKLKEIGGNYDVMHSTYFTTYKNLKIPQVITVHDLIHEKFLNKNFLNKFFIFQKKKAIISADQLICISHQTALDLEKIYKINSEKIEVIHLGVSSAFRVELSKEQKDLFIKNKNLIRPFLLFVGNRSAYKNFKLFLESFANRDDKELDLVVVGGGRLNKDEVRLVDQLKLSRNVFVFQKVSDAELNYFYRSAKAFIFPSLYEGFGLPLLEAMSCGTLVLASDIPVFREIAGDVPIYFDPLNTESILGSFRAISNNNSEKISLGVDVSLKYTWESTARKTQKLYRTLANL